MFKKENQELFMGLGLLVCLMSGLFYLLVTVIIPSETDLVKRQIVVVNKHLVDGKRHHKNLVEEDNDSDEWANVEENWTEDFHSVNKHRRQMDEIR